VGVRFGEHKLLHGREHPHYFFLRRHIKPVCCPPAEVGDPRTVINKVRTPSLDTLPIPLVSQEWGLNV
jgi:hypothetical protein